MPILIKGINISPQSLKVGDSFTIIVNAEDTTWETINDTFQSWGEVRRSFQNWDKVKNFIYTIPNPTATKDCLYSSDGYAIFDVDAIQISISGGATSQYTAEQIDWFVREVLNE